MHPKLLLQSSSVSKMVCTMIQQKVHIWNSVFNLGNCGVKMAWHPIQFECYGLAFNVMVDGAPQVPIYGRARMEFGFSIDLYGFP